MAITLAAKPAGATYRYTWDAPVSAGDSVTAVTVVVTSGTVTIAYVMDGDAVIITASGGAAGETALLAASATTANGEALAEAFYLPIRSGENDAGNTAHDICAFALRKISGLGEDPEAEQLTDALEVLNDMLAEWRMDGMDVGVPGVLISGDVLTVADEFLAPIKYNLLVRVAENYDRPITPIVMAAAERGKQLVANRLLALSSLSFEGPNLPIRTMRGLDDL